MIISDIAFYRFAALQSGFAIEKSRGKCEKVQKILF